MRKSLHLYPLYLVGLLALVAVAYYPGLSGTFLLDDYGSLPPLAQWGEINSFEKLSQFVSGGYTGPMGRPIPLLTFAMNANDWPTSARPFLVTNLVIHLVNIGLVFIFISGLFRAGQYSERQVLWVAGLSAAIWGLHPYLASTVLYIVQRMTLLSATFSFLTFIFYLAGRGKLLTGKYYRGLLWWIAGSFAAICALLSKENAVLIPLQLLLIEVFLRHKGSVLANLVLKRGVLIGLGVASLVVCYKLIAHVDHHIWALILEGRSLTTNRDFSFAERLLTQNRIVGEYMLSTFVPPIQTAGVFQDGYLVSKSFTQPFSTVVWFVIHISLVVVSFFFRRKLPVLFFGVLWFYGSHLVESSVVMLELKFEHRNYIPSLGLILPLAVLVGTMKVGGKSRWVLSVFGIAILSVLLFARSSLWGNPEQSSLVWVEENPKSQRALENAALVYGKNSENYEIVKQLLRRAIEVSNGDPVLAMKYANYSCKEFDATDQNWGAISDRFISSAVNWQVYQVLSEALDRIASKRCQHINLEQFSVLTDKILQNTKYRKTGTPKLIRELRARAALIFGEKEIAIALYREQVELGIPLSMVMRQALWLASYGELEVASDLLRLGIKKSKQADLYLLDQAQDMKSKIDAEVVVQ